MKLSNLSSTLFLFFFLFVSMPGFADAGAKSPLPSWAEGKNKREILDFVTAVVDKASGDFVPEEDRVATFDMDGTLLVEKPEAMVMYFSLYSVATFAKNNPNVDQQPYVAYRTNDRGYLAKNIIQVLTAPFLGLTPVEYRQQVLSFSETQKHPKFNVPYQSLFYAPMLELIAYLRENRFRVFIVSGSDQEFIRGMVRKRTGIVDAHMVGAQIKLDYKVDKVVRTDTYRELGVAGSGKPISIAYLIGQRPVLAFGNTSGDQQMFEYTAANERYRHLVLWLDHDDAKREFAYDGGVRPEAGWLKVSMKNDFARVFVEK